MADTAMYLRAGAPKAEGAPLQGVLFKQYFSSRIKTGTDRSSGRAGQWNRVGRKIPFRDWHDRHLGKWAHRLGSP